MRVRRSRIACAGIDHPDVTKWAPGVWGHAKAARPGFDYYDERPDRHGRLRRP
jgi:hypothetical protein